MKALPHLATRVFGTPLMINQQKLEVIIAAIGPRIYGFSEEDLTGGSERCDYSVTGDGIAIIPVEGTLVRKSSGMDALSGMCSYEDLKSSLTAALGDSGIRAILFDIDSPGGEVSGLLDLADAIYASRGIKPMFAAVNDMACSAAYAIASACDRIFVTRTGCVGSIGVVMAHADQSKFDEKLGVKVTYIYAGDRKVDGNPHEPLSERAEETFQGEIDRVYSLFVGMVARNRKIGDKAVRGQQAGVFFGEDGVANGLADAVGTPEDAMSALRAKISAKTGGGMLASGTPVNLVHADASWLTAPAGAEALTATINPDGTITISEVQAPAADASAPNSPEEASDMANPIPADAGPKTEPHVPAAAKENCDDDMKKAKPTEEDDEDEDSEDDPDDQDADDKKKKGKKKMADFEQIAVLCKIAGKPELCADFITRGLTLAAAQDALLESRAAESESHSVSSFVGALSTSSLDNLEAQAASLASSKGVTKQQAYRTLLEKNPKAYDQYVDEHQAMTSNPVMARKYMDTMYQRFTGTL